MKWLLFSCLVPHLVPHLVSGLPDPPCLVPRLVPRLVPHLVPCVGVSPGHVLTSECAQCVGRRDRLGRRTADFRASGLPALLPEATPSSQPPAAPWPVQSPQGLTVWQLVAPPSSVPDSDPTATFSTSYSQEQVTVHPHPREGSVGFPRPLCPQYLRPRSPTQ